MSLPEPRPIARFTVDSLTVQVFEDRAQMDRAAARAVAQAIAACQAEAGRAHLVFAAAPSQNEFLASLVAHPEIDWSRVVGFHIGSSGSTPPAARSSSTTAASTGSRTYRRTPTR
jgi:glucosamine-6-phosphate deaminase